MMFAGFIVISAVVLYFSFRGPVAHSDVPVTSEVGWWVDQDGLKITEFSAEAVDPDLGLSLFYDRSHFLMRFHIKGTLRYTGMGEHWKPTIAKVQLTARVVTPGTANDNYEAIADALLVPVVEIKKDDSYNGDEIPFNLTIEHVFSAMNWGKNLYNIQCQGKTVSVTVQVSK